MMIWDNVMIQIVRQGGQTGYRILVGGGMAVVAVILIHATYPDASWSPYYKVEVDDGEEVVVEARDGTGVFSLVLLESSLAGVEFEVEKD